MKCKKICASCRGISTKLAVLKINVRCNCVKSFSERWNRDQFEVKKRKDHQMYYFIQHQEKILMVWDLSARIQVGSQTMEFFKHKGCRYPQMSLYLSMFHLGIFRLLLLILVSCCNFSLYQGCLCHRIPIIGVEI